MPVGCLAPYFVWSYLATPLGAIGPVLAEPMRDESLQQLGDANPLLSCVYWIGDSSQGTWLAATKPEGGGWHKLPLPERTADLPRHYRAACLCKKGWGKTSYGAVGLTVSGGWYGEP